MLSFENDYAEGAHPEVLRKLLETNLEQLPGYGTDRYGASAAEKIRHACGCEQAQVFFISGGTQTNRTVIAAMLQGYEGVISAVTGHVNGHEAGAIESTGHKVLAIPGEAGKLRAKDVKDWIDNFYADSSYTHMVFPGMVYISHPTEYGTLYTRQELEALHQVCRERNIPLYLDGARLGYGLTAPDTDVTLKDIAQLCDVFYIGGTKVGAICGEAVVFTRNNAPRNFMTTVKQNGAMLAKGRLLGVQFDALFTDDLYYEAGRNALKHAETLKEAFREKGYPFFLDSPTNQIFVVLSPERMARLQDKVRFSVWEKTGEGDTVVRFATSWATTEEMVQRLIAML